MRMRLLGWWSDFRRKATDAVEEVPVFRRQIAHEFARASRLGRPFAVIAFEQFDSGADASLGELVTALRRRMRTTDAVGWLGTHELGLLLRFTSSADALALAQQIQLALDERVGSKVCCTVFCHPPPALQSGTHNDATCGETAPEQCAS
jgi:hypothetical protein